MPGISHLERISHSKGFRHPSLDTGGQVGDRTLCPIVVQYHPGPPRQDVVFG